MLTCNGTGTKIAWVELTGAHVAHFSHLSLSQLRASATMESDQSSRSMNIKSDIYLTFIWTFWQVYQKFGSRTCTCAVKYTLTKFPNLTHCARISKIFVTISLHDDCCGLIYWLDLSVWSVWSIIGWRSLSLTVPRAEAPDTKLVSKTPGCSQ